MRKKQISYVETLSFHRTFSDANPLTSLFAKSILIAVSSAWF